ncbi:MULTISPECIES: zinc ribbon domain-containing protein [Deferrisoma]
METAQQDVLGLLERLQRVADEIDRLSALRAEAEEARDRARQDLDEAKQSLDAFRERAHALDIERRKRELAIKDGKDRMQRIKARMGDVKTSREYQAVLAEMSSAKQTVAEEEQALERDLAELEAVRVDLERVEARARELEAVLEEAEQRLAEVQGETEQAMAERKAEEQRLLADLPQDVVDRYRLIRSRRGGLAVVEARDEACTACYMRIPPQMYIEIIRRTRVMQCPNCHRILVPPREPAAEG